MPWQDLARRQHGAITRAQLRATGLTNSSIDTLIRRGRLRPVHKAGVFCAAAVRPTVMTQCWLAILSTAAVLSHLSAAQAWGIDVPQDGRMHVTVPGRRSTRMPVPVRVHRVLLPAGAATELDGLPITDRSRTVIDCLGLLRMPEARRLFDRALQQKWITLSAVRQRLDTEPGRRGNVALRMLVAEASEGDAPSERLLLRILRSAGISGWRANQAIDVGWARFTVDVCFAAQRIVLEVDGWAYHHDVARFRADRARDNALRLAGWTVYRFTWDQLTERPWSVLETVRRALAQGM